MVTRSFYFLRHGETDWNVAGRLQGWTDTPLNNNGIAQAKIAQAKIETLNIDVFVASNLQRARHTAEIINTKENKPLFIDERLKERGFGIFEGLNNAEMDAWRQQALLDKTLPIEETGYPLPDNAEPYVDLVHRVKSCLIDYLDQHDEKNVMFVSHGGVFRAIRRLLIGEAKQTGNVIPWHFKKVHESWEIIEV